MSNGTVTAASLILEQELVVRESQSSAAGLAILLYEIVYTFSEVVALLREGRRTQIIIFSLNYLNLLAMGCAGVFEALQWKTTLGLSCDGMAVFSVISDAVYMIVNVVISYMLILAISHGNQTLSVITLLMGLGSVGLSLCQHASMHFLSMYGVCWSSITLKFTEDDFVIIGSTYAICALFCNLIVIVSAWFYLHRSLLSEGVLRRTNTVAGTLLKDGTMYFMALSALHFQYVIDYACTFTCNPSGDLYNILAVTSGPSQLLPSILLSRLLLHLHEASSGEYSGTHNGGTHTGTWLQDLEFARSQILSSELVPQSSANEAEVMDADGAGYNDPENGMNQEE